MPRSVCAKLGGGLLFILILADQFSATISITSRISSTRSRKTSTNMVSVYPLSDFTEGPTGLADMKPGVSCPSNFLTRPGKYGDGGKWTCGLSLLAQQPHCIIYSFGVNDESSFEADVLLTAPNCRVYAYDPTVNHIGVPLTGSTDKRIHFQKVGIAGKNEVRGKQIYRTLKTLMEENGGHTWIDILKMDVEGDEFGALHRILQDWPYPQELPFGQLNMELHHWAFTNSQIVQLLKQLEARGLRLFSVEENGIQVPLHCCAEFSFINVKLLDNIWKLSQRKD